ncbi:MAG: AMP-binding protein [Desulforhopalus sp.]
MRNFTLYDLFVRNARLSGKETAIVAGDERMSFDALLDRVELFAADLVNRGVGKGDRVAVLAMNHPGYFVLFGAVSRLGAILVPLNWRLSGEEIRYILADSSPKVLLADQAQFTTATEICSSLPVPVVQFADFGVVAEKDRQRHDAAGIDGDAPCCIIYTAAVEGSPRGAVLSHNNLISANLQVIVSMGLTRADVNLNMLPLFHITGINLGLAVMQVGGKNVIIEKFNEKDSLALTVREKVSVWGSFPPMLQRLVDEVKAGQYDVSSLKHAVGLDGPDNIKPFEELTGGRFWILYGQSETSGFVTFSPASEKFGTAGKQGVLSTFSLVDEEDEEVADGDVGEIVVRGPLVFQGYWQLEDVNRRTFRNGWHHTGDLGMIDEDGYLVFKGRKPEKELIKPGGENVYPAEVETVILEHPAVAAVSVIGVPDPKFGEGVKAVCVLKEHMTLDSQTLIEFVGARIARYKKPGYVEFVDSLPMLEGGRIDRTKVKELYGQ